MGKKSCILGANSARRSQIIITMSRPCCTPSHAKWLGKICSHRKLLLLNNRRQIRKLRAPQQPFRVQQARKLSNLRPLKSMNSEELEVKIPPTPTQERITLWREMSSWEEGAPPQTLTTRSWSQRLIFRTSTWARIIKGARRSRARISSHSRSKSFLRPSARTPRPMSTWYRGRHRATNSSPRTASRRLCSLKLLLRKLLATIFRMTLKWLSSWERSRLWVILDRRERL